MYGRIVFDKFEYNVKEDTDMTGYVRYHPDIFIDRDVAVEISRDFVSEKFRKRGCIPRFYSASVPMLSIEVHSVDEAKEAVDICIEVSKYLQCRLPEYRLKKMNKEVNEYINKVITT